MSKEEIEEEVKARVNFKLDELIAGMRNTANRNWHMAFSLNNPKYSHYWEAFEQMVEMMEKERWMPPPYDEMAIQKKRFARDEAVNQLQGLLIQRGARRDDERHIIRQVVSIVEKAQKF